MNKVVTSKNIDGITDLVVVAPIREGFINAYENVTYATRLRIVAEALNRVRVSAREHEKITPFSDVTERILTLLDFRVGVIDKDLFALPADQKEEEATKANPAKQSTLRSRRFLYLTATFDGAWEPYMRLIWDPLGPFLDLLFCNCEGYVTAGEHSFEEYAQWVRDNQMDSAIFYSTTGLTVRDHLYLNRLEQIQRAGPADVAEQKIARLTMPDPEKAALAERQKAGSNYEQSRKVHELALEALTVLYRLADYYPPEWMARPGQTATGADLLAEGHYLLRASESLLKGWQCPDPEKPPIPPGWGVVEQVYRDPLSWFRTGRKHLRELEAERDSNRPKDPPVDVSEVQGGVLKAQGSKAAPMRSGALLLMSIVDTAAARDFLASLEANELHFGPDESDATKAGFYRTLGLTAEGLRRLGLRREIVDWFPKEFREGMEMRAGLMGDMRENHPRDWTLPTRNWPALPQDAMKRPPIDMGEVDLVLQIRSAQEDQDSILAEIDRIAGAATGIVLLGYELMQGDYSENGDLLDLFGFRDGISQPKPAAELSDDARKRDDVRLGEVLLGYRNDRDDDAPTDFGIERRRAALDYQFNGTFMVIRKLEQQVDPFESFVADAVRTINQDHPKLATPMTADRLKARMLGRYPNGDPLIEPGANGRNDFDYEGDEDGSRCPFASHIRRSNPRSSFQGRRTPRLVRRGMLFDHRDGVGGTGGRGLMFMAFNASIAEQFETIQRWINGGNSTFIASGHNDPIMGVAPKTGAMTKVDRVFRFVEGDEVIRVKMPADPFVSLHWGLYLFMPARTALRQLSRLTARVRALPEPRERLGAEVIARIDRIENDKVEGAEWKRLLEDFDAKDPTERDLSRDVWSAIRWYKGGSLKIEGGVPSDKWFSAFFKLFEGSHSPSWDKEPGDDQPTVLCASYQHIMHVLSDWKTFSTEEQLRRIEASGIPIFVTQQPDNRYKSRALNQKGLKYEQESTATNRILMGYSEEDGFRDGYIAGKKILDMAKHIAANEHRRQTYFEMELRRQYLLAALANLCQTWYGAPDGETFQPGAWTWQPPAERQPPGPRCPGDFLSPSRNAFYPRPTPTVAGFGDQHGKAVHEGSKAFVAKHKDDRQGLGTVASRMFDEIEDPDVLARNLVGTMIGAIPPMDGNLRGILLEWLLERSLWRHQAALRRATGDRPAIEQFAAARAVLYGPVSQAMCKRPAPDLLYRTATKSKTLKAGEGYRNPKYGKDCDVEIRERDLVVVSLVSAAQRSLDHPDTPDGDVSIIFGGNRRAAHQPEIGKYEWPVHACPAQAMAMGAIMGILAALLDAGRIQALPASLIVRVSDW